MHGRYNRPAFATGMFLKSEKIVTLTLGYGEENCHCITLVPHDLGRQTSKTFCHDSVHWFE